MVQIRLSVTTASEQNRAGRRPRRDYTLAFKRAVCRLRDSNVTLTQSQLQDLIEEQCRARVEQPTLSRILKGRERWLSATLLERTRLRRGQHDEMEQALVAWAHHWLDHNGVLTYALLQAQAALLGARFNVTHFRYSHGWCARFCRRHGLTLRRRVGEAGSTSQANVELARNSIPLVLAVLGARPQDVFNADETGLVLGSQPCKTMAFARVSGVKKEKDRISVMLCCNATGDEKMKPVVIAKAARPRCFGGIRTLNAFDPSVYCHYFSQPAAYMTRELFNIWLSRVQGEMAAVDRTIFLLVDNCSAHGCTLEEQTEQTIHGIKVICIPHIWLIYLPANCTSAVQPLDQGIIYSMKARYRKWYMQWLLTQTVLDPCCIENLPRLKPDLRKGILCLAQIWESLPASIILSSWARANIMPLEVDSRDDLVTELQTIRV